MQKFPSLLKCNYRLLIFYTLPDIIAAAKSRHSATGQSFLKM